MLDLHFLFLQGLPSSFFSRVAWKLSALGCRATSINLCVGDQLYWRGPRRVNYRGTLENWPRYIADFLDSNGVTDIVLVGERRTYHKYAIEAAHARGIRVIVTDFGYLRPDWITLERDGMTGDSKFPREPAAIRRLAANVPKMDFSIRYTDDFWKMAEGDIVYHFATYFLWWLFPHYRLSYRRPPPLLNYPSIGLRLISAAARDRQAVRRLSELVAAKARYFLFPLQLENDFQIVSYSPFNSLEEAIRLILESFAAHAAAGTRLVVKTHPLEPGLKNWKKMIHRWAGALGIGDRIDYLDGGNLDDMIRASIGMITVNSTAGIRALQFGRPVMALGAAIYNVEGLTHQGKLDRYWKEAAAPEPALVEDFVNAVAATIQVRGGFYSEAGLRAAVEETVDRLCHGKVVI